MIAHREIIIKEEEAITDTPWNIIIPQITTICVPMQNQHHLGPTILMVYHYLQRLTNTTQIRQILQMRWT